MSIKVYEIYSYNKLEISEKIHVKFIDINTEEANN